MNVVVSAVILAAGQGTRMRSALPKPAHRLCGRPMVSYGIDALSGVGAHKVVVVIGHGGERVRQAVLDHRAGDVDVAFTVQRTQRGTGDAAQVGLEAFTSEELDDEDALLIVMPGDQPLVRPATIESLVEAHVASGAAATILTALMDDPTGYGRVIRDTTGRVRHIVEHRDASDDELAVREINTSVYCFNRSLVGPALRRVTPDNAQGEFYLTDVIGVLREAGYGVAAHVGDADEMLGINDRAQLAAAEAVLRRRINNDWLRRGVTIVDPDATYIDGTVELGEDVTVFPGALVQGRSTVGSGTSIGAGSHLVDTTVGARSRVESTRAHGATIGDDAHVGPFAALAPGAVIEDGTSTGPHYGAPG